MIYSMKGIQGHGKLLATEGMRCPENVTCYLMLKEYYVILSYLEIGIRDRLPIPGTQIAQTAAAHRCVKWWWY